MIRSIGQAARRSTLAAIIVSSFVLAACTEVVTFSRKSREEGMRLFAEKAYGDAAGAFRNAIRQEPRDYRSHFYLGVCYQEMAEYQQAFQEYYTALDVMSNTQEGKFDPDFRLIVLDTLAGAIAQHDAQEVELNKVEARAKAGQKAEDWFLLGKIYRLRGDGDMALECYRRAARWDTDSFAIRKEFGLYLLDPLNQRQEAEYYLRQAYRLDPNDEAVNAALARLGVVPFPPYKEKDTLPRTPQPYTGPLPSNANNRPVANTPQPAPMPGTRVETPRD
jgi:Tfp pilus assembly protein PilF